MPSLCHSVHWLRDRNVNVAIGQFIEREREQVLAQRSEWIECLPPQLRASVPEPSR